MLSGVGRVYALLYRQIAEYVFLSPARVSLAIIQIYMEWACFWREDLQLSDARPRPRYMSWDTMAAQNQTNTVTYLFGWRSFLLCLASMPKFAGLRNLWLVYLCVWLWPKSANENQGHLHPHSNLWEYSWFEATAFCRSPNDVFFVFPRYSWLRISCIGFVC